MPEKLDIYTGSLVYKDIEFTFVFDNSCLRLIPPRCKTDEINYEWFMQKIGEGAYSVGNGDIPSMDEPYLIGRCNENGKRIVFITAQSSIGKRNDVLFVDVLAYYMINSFADCINSISFYCPEIDCIHQIGQQFIVKRDKNFSENRVLDIQTMDSKLISTETESFVCDSEEISVNFGSVRTISYTMTETPIKMNSCLTFEFEETNDYEFVFKLCRIAKQFIQYLCYRKNVYFQKIKLTSQYDENKRISCGDVFMLSDLDNKIKEQNLLRDGRYIKYKYIQGNAGTILQSIADNSIYLGHLPNSYEDGRHKTAASFVMITAGFEWEFKRLFSEGVKKSSNTIEAEESILKLLDELIDKHTSREKSILKSLKKCVRKDSLASRITFAGKELGEIIDAFGKYLYRLNDEELNYSEMGERLAKQRNNYAHGNIDKELCSSSILDLAFLEMEIYAMQLKYYGLDVLSIKKAINDLFQMHLRLD